MNSDRDRLDIFTHGLWSSGSRSRRGVLAGVGGGIGTLLTSAFRADDTRARKRRKKKGKPKPPGTPPACPPCGECRTCQNGNCVPVTDDAPCGQCGRCLNGACAIALDRSASCGACATCEAGRCVNKPVYTPCDGSPGLCTLPAVCYNGACNEGVCYFPPAPFCNSFPMECTMDDECCSRKCCGVFGTPVRYCCESEPGDPCVVDEHCVAGASCVAYRCYT
jgi:hypothetical protein